MVKKKNKTRKQPEAPQRAKPLEPAVPKVERSEINYFWFIWAGLMLLGAFLRCYDIANRPLHNDEGVNYFFIESIRRDGFFRYSHENYHGPTYFYLTALCTFLFGDSEFGLRSSAIFAGIGVMALPLLLRKLEGDLFVLLSTAILAVSSSLTFYSRYAIHESFFLLSGGLLALSMYRWRMEKKVVDIYLAFLALGLLVATKETFIVSLASIGLAFLTTGVDRNLLSAAAAQKKHFINGAVLMTAVIALFFTGGLQWSGGLVEMFQAVPQWLGRNKSDTGHFKPFSYYLSVYSQAEPQVFAGLAAILALFIFDPRRLRSCFSDKTSAFMPFLFSWTLSAWLVYSIINYKTPWLIISITFPAALLAAWVLSELYRWGGEITRKTAAVAAVILVGVGVFFDWRYVYAIPYTNFNPYSYVHTTKGMIDLRDALVQYSEHQPIKKILVGVEQYWPIPYYLKPWADRGLVEYMNITDDYLKGGKSGSKDPLLSWNEMKGKYSVIIVNRDKIWDDPAWARIYYRLSDVQESQTYFLRGGVKKK